MLTSNKLDLYTVFDMLAETSLTNLDNKCSYQIRHLAKYRQDNAVMANSISQNSLLQSSIGKKKLHEVLLNYSFAIHFKHRSVHYSNLNYNCIIILCWSNNCMWNWWQNCMYKIWTIHLFSMLLTLCGSWGKLEWISADLRWETMRCLRIDACTVNFTVHIYCTRTSLSEIEPFSKQ